MAGPGVDGEVTPPKYARIERERRFLVRRFPEPKLLVRTRRITDRYIEGTNLRLREQQEDGALPVFKLTQKVPAPGSGAQQGYLTTIYLDRDTYERLLQLPAQVLVKVRHSVPPFGVDAFEGALQGLVLAEAEFDSPEQAEHLAIPDFIGPEVSGDARFTGGCMARASHDEVEAWLKDYGRYFMAASDS